MCSASRSSQKPVKILLAPVAAFCMCFVVLAGIKEGVRIFYYDVMLPNSCRAVYHASGRQESTYLGLAVRANDLQCAKEFLEFGEHPDEVDRHGKTPIEIAAENENTSTLKLLLEYGAHIGSSLSIAVCRGHVEAVQILADTGASGVHDYDCSPIKEEIVNILGQPSNHVLFNTNLPSTGGIMNHGRETITANNRECWMLCESTRACVAWSRLKKNNANGQREGECWLRAYSPVPRQSTFYDSGVIPFSPERNSKD